MKRRKSIHFLQLTSARTKCPIDDIHSTLPPFHEKKAELEKYRCIYIKPKDNILVTRKITVQDQQKKIAEIREIGIRNDVLYYLEQPSEMDRSKGFQITLINSRYTSVTFCNHLVHIAGEKRCQGCPRYGYPSLSRLVRE